MRFQRRVESVAYSLLNSNRVDGGPSITLVAFAEMEEGQSSIKVDWETNRIPRLRGNLSLHIHAEMGFK